MSLTLEECAVVGKELALKFSDGREAFLPIAMMRRACPCAACQGEPDALGRVMRPMVNHGPNAFDLKKIEIVGGYGIQPTWKDGHSSGIYTFDYLMRLRSMMEIDSGDKA